jgi:signal transduction histidine kinase
VRRSESRRVLVTPLHPDNTVDIPRDVNRDRRDTDRTLREERERTDRVLAGEPVDHADDILEQARADAEAQLREVRGDVDAHLGRQAEILPKITETLEEVADSLATAATSLTGVADTLKSSGATVPPGTNAEHTVETLAEAAQDLVGAAGAIAMVQPPVARGADTAVSDAPVELVEKLAEIAGGVADVAADLDAERQAADDKLRKERELTDHILGEQLEQAESAIIADVAADRGMLIRERQATDHELAKERRHTDQAMDHVLEVLAEEQDAHGAARREFSSRNDFLAIVSHDLRGPLTSISLASTLIAHLARSGAEVPELTDIKEAADRVQRSASVMERLITDLLDFASFEDGNLRVAASQHDIRTLIERAIDVFRPLAAAKSLALDIVMPPAPVTAVFDPDRMLQVVSNVLQNAIKFTPAGGAVRVRAAQAGRECLIAVSDTGIGISDAELPKIFERFRTLDDDRVGLGLGLYISKWIVEAHGGRIWADSRRGDGSTFYIALPAEA